jgi:hypothetical protein
LERAKGIEPSYAAWEAAVPSQQEIAGGCRRQQVLDCGAFVSNPIYEERAGGST